jgi:hypothetical protein
MKTGFWGEHLDLSQGTSWLVERLLASQEGLCFTEIVFRVTPRVTRTRAVLLFKEREEHVWHRCFIFPEDKTFATPFQCYCPHSWNPSNIMGWKIKSCQMNIQSVPKRCIHIIIQNINLLFFYLFGTACIYNDLDVGWAFVISLCYYLIINNQNRGFKRFIYFNNGLNKI